MPIWCPKVKLHARAQGALSVSRASQDISVQLFSSDTPGRHMPKLPIHARWYSTCTHYIHKRFHKITGAR